MTEREYTDLENLTKIRTLLPLVRDLMHGDVIDRDDQIKIEHQLMDWRDELTKRIKIKESK
jgi:hypothetical protein